MIEVTIIMGGSGRWIAREIISRAPDGRPSRTGRVWTGHVPRRKLRPDQRPGDIVARQIRNGRVAVATWDQIAAAPRGGSTWEQTVDVAPIDPEALEAIKASWREEKEWRRKLFLRSR